MTNPFKAPFPSLLVPMFVRQGAPFFFFFFFLYKIYVIEKPPRFIEISDSY